MIKEIVNEAYNYSKFMHRGQKRRFSGLEYFTHPKYVARVTNHLTKNPTLVAAALLHDVIEDTKATELVVREKFGDEITNLVVELTNDSSSDSYKESKSQYIATKMLDMTDEALIVKLVDRFHNVLFLEEDNVDVKFKRKYWVETTSILMILKKMRKLNKIQKVVANRIEAILKFLAIRYEWQ